MSKFAFLNDGFIEERSVTLHFSDLAFQRGYGVFDFFRLAGNKPLFLQDHLERFYFSAQQMHLPVPFEESELKAIIWQLIQKNKLPNTGIRISLTGGYSTDGFLTGKPNLIVSQHAFAPPTAEQQKVGIKLLSHSYQRQLPQIKSIDYLMAVWLQPFKNQEGADDILYHSNGFVTECPRSNFFLVTDTGTIVTPDENVLKGITRKKVIEVAKETFTVEERPLHIEELKTAREAFITSTTKQILPVRNIDGITLPERKVSSELLQKFRDKYCL